MSTKRVIIIKGNYMANHTGVEPYNFKFNFVVTNGFYIKFQEV